MTALVPIVRARVGQTHLAIELEHVFSLFGPDQTEDLEVIAVSSMLGERYVPPGAVAVVEFAGDRFALALDEVAGYEQWDTSRLARLPDWIAGFLPNILKPACGLGDDGTIVWIIEPRALAQPNAQNEK